ncbi:MAG: chemotaxis protein CheW [Natronospirillum sp.]
MSSSDSTKKKVATELAPAKLALNSYLAIMLEEATSWEDDLAEEPEVAEPEAVAEPEPIEVVPEVKQTPEPEPEPAIEPEPVAEPEPEPIAKAPVPETPVVVPEPQPTFDETVHLAESQPVLAWKENGRPGWAQNRFDCLLFKVDGLALAVPMLLLGTIYQMDSELTSLFDQPEWFLGLLRVHDGRNIRVVDTAQLVMPERYRPEAVESLAYAIGIHECDWAMGCHEVIGSITLTPDDVKWRTERTRRPWLAGTVVDHMCALIDLDAFESQLLSQAAKKKRSR